MMETRTVKIQAATGLHDRWAAYFVQKANEFQSDIYICFGSLRLNAKSLMGIMCMDLPPYAEVTLMAEGEDSASALDFLANLLQESRMPAIVMESHSEAIVSFP